ncbi:MAG: tonb family protein [Bacteroidetes bacterium]|nr:tonb family protein [Bacteroidota bacterium]
MKETNNNKKGYLSEVERYVRGEMSQREENSFQRRLLQDPFSDEATDGYTGISQKEAVKDLEHLEKKIKERVRPKQRILYYRIAASIAALLVLASVTVLVLRSRSKARLADLFIPAQSIEAFQPSPGTDSAITDETVLTNPEQNVPETGNQQIAVNELVQTQESDVTVTDVQSPESAPVTEDREAEAALDDSGAAALRSDSAVKMAEAVLISGNSTSRNMTAAPVRNETDAAEPLPDAPSQPAEGQENYTKYIKENIRRPAATESMDNAVVVISFQVLSTGAIDSINIINTPGDEFSNEAIRLIKEGPSWLPAVKNGQKADDTVTLRVVFK